LIFEITGFISSATFIPSFTFIAKYEKPGVFAL